MRCRPSGGALEYVDGAGAAYIDDLAGDFVNAAQTKSRMRDRQWYRVSLCAPIKLDRIGVEVVGLHTGLDYPFSPL